MDEDRTGLTQQQFHLLAKLRLYEQEPAFESVHELQLPKEKPSQPLQSLLAQYAQDIQYDPEHEALRQKLVNYRRKSEQVHNVGTLLESYEQKFKELVKQKNNLLQMIKQMRGETPELVEKQTRMIDLSMKMKETLDYYAYHDKFKFDFACEVSSREIFEDSLQPILSEIMDGIDFFTEKTTYVAAKQHLAMFRSSRTKVLSFTKSFLIKLFNKEDSFQRGNDKVSLLGCVDSYYPKSKIKFVLCYLCHFPQFQGQLRQILLNVKDGASQKQLQELQAKEFQITKFQLSENNLSLITYLQCNFKDVYEETVLHLLAFYRVNLHENLLKRGEWKKEAKFADLIKERYIGLTYLLANQYAYLLYCSKAVRANAVEGIQNILTTISNIHSNEISKLIKDLRNKAPFDVCDRISEIAVQFPRFLDNHRNEQYESYTFGRVCRHMSGEHMEFLKDLVLLMLQRHQAELQSICYMHLPKVVTGDRHVIEEQVRQLIHYIPRLKYCPHHVERYMIASLETLVKSIREVNLSIDTRLNCFVWNLQIFSNLRKVIKESNVTLIQRQLKIDTHNSATVLERVRQVEKTDNLLKYAQDIFNVLKTGMPVINELTLDFVKYINEHCASLETQFVKDMLFVYGKNMIEFLQRVTDAKQRKTESVTDVCQLKTVSSLRSSFLLNIDKFLTEAKEVLEARKEFAIGEIGLNVVLNLLDEVYERLFELMDNFYRITSEYISEQFEEIQALKTRYSNDWGAR